ncbi:hypothetical protein [Wolbachia endosymbiont of Ctenocephalides felis wCfeJ]|uniref:hypothetical protein n=1 Tax=Wolbachia endosymbiont of Ctenocephalides felis wCfeJ TaxID=2732594 RepID=UPI0014482B64|nr:hypothetical protein [Wolbachia endosymbiont of Ctenocephalides felis wCfeJ]WCR58532.1 MAG: hypothetical protein PG980_001004 [Wolbachia endosymbiont of Ctenocephalides felis wCfeJ]
MSNTKETVKALIRAFNVHNYARNTVETNFTVQSRNGKDYIVVSFDKDMDHYQCTRYLSDIKRKIVSEFYGIQEEDTDEVVLNTANLIFDVKSFPFDMSKGKWSMGEQGRIEFVSPIDEGVIFNLKSHLASSLKKDVLEDMQVSSKTMPFDKERYLCHAKFPNTKLRKQFEGEFLSRLKKRYENVPKELLKVKGNDVYIRNAVDDVRFIDSVTRYITLLLGMHLEVNSNNNSKVRLFKNLIIRSIYQSTGVEIEHFMCASPLGRKDASVLIPIVLDSGKPKLLTNEEAFKINYAFDGAVLNDLYNSTQAELLLGAEGVYAINFSNSHISQCVMTKIIENSVINKDHELSIDPELPFQAMSPVRSPGGVSNAECNGDLPSSSLKSPDSSELPRPPNQVFPGYSLGQHK